MKKLGACLNQGVLAIIRCKIFCLPVSIKNIKIKIYRNIMLPVVLYGCETWSLTLREECRLRVFENKVLRRIFGPKWDEITGSGEDNIKRSFIYALYSLPNIIRVIKSRRLSWAGRVARTGEGEEYTVL
jgi:hypothetical protein